MEALNVTIDVNWNEGEGSYDITITKGDAKEKTAIEVTSYVHQPNTYTVIFSETNNLENVSIQLYSDAARTVPLSSPLTTNACGTSTKNLEDGLYWFAASLIGYDEYNGSFEIDGADKDYQPKQVESFCHLLM